MNGPSIAEQFGIIIRRLRKEKGLSQEDFADLCKIHRTYVGSIERGEKAVTIETASKIAKALDLPLSQIFLQIEMEHRNDDIK